jgi:type IV fimbrial biogenesis protein FimT
MHRRRHRPPCRTAGFTLVEAMITLLVASLLLGLAVPAWSNASEAARAVAARGAMQDTLDEAMRHASVAGTEVVVCPGTDACRDTWDWSGGWLAWADANGNRHRDAGERLLVQAPALPGRVHLRSTRGRRRLVLRPHGGAAAGTNVPFTLSDGRGPSRTVALVLANSGRLRDARPGAAAVAECLGPA